MDLVPESPEVSVVLNSLVAAIGTLSTAAQKKSQPWRVRCQKCFVELPRVADQSFDSGIPRHRMGSAIKAMAVA